MANEILLGLFIAVIAGGLLALVCQLISFIYEVPKQLKRIADALEKRAKDGKGKPSVSMAGNSEDDLQPIGVCMGANCCRKANDFCSYAERKDNAR